MTKKLLYQFDTDPLPSVFDNVVAYDGGADQVTSYGGITPQNVGGLVEGAIFTRGPKHKKLTALFIGGSDLVKGEALLAAVCARFFGDFRVSVMLDSNGANTTAAAAVACAARVCSGRSLAGKRAVVLAGTGPVGQRAAEMLSREGAQVVITGRQLDRAVAVAQAIAARSGHAIEGLAAVDNVQRQRAIDGAHIVIATGSAGTSLLTEAAWSGQAQLEVVCDANPTPPLGIEGIDMMDRAQTRHGKASFGAIGFGALKLSLHRACIARLFEQPDLVLDAPQILTIAKDMIAEVLP